MKQEVSNQSYNDSTSQSFQTTLPPTYPPPVQGFQQPVQYPPAQGFQQPMQYPHPPAYPPPVQAFQQPLQYPAAAYPPQAYTPQAPVVPATGPLEVNEPFDNGPFPSWDIIGSRSKRRVMIIPESEQDSIIASSEIKKSNCSVSSGWVARKIIPELKYPLHYDLKWDPYCFMNGKATYEEINSYCNTAAGECNDQVMKDYKLRKSYRISITVFICFFISMFLSSISLVFLGISLVGMVIAGFFAFSFSSKVSKNSEKVHKKLAEYIHRTKGSLLQRGIRPRPGAYGVFIQFIPA